jgi:hypothetical protein
MFILTASTRIIELDGTARLKQILLLIPIFTSCLHITPTYIDVYFNSS